LDAELEVEAEAEPLCWRLVEEYSTAAGMLCTVEAGVAAEAHILKESLGADAVLARERHWVMLEKTAGFGQAAAD
jgi:hypothetical protein